jgi:hypothetical protein
MFTGAKGVGVAVGDGIVVGDGMVVGAVVATAGAEGWLPPPQAERMRIRRNATFTSMAFARVNFFMLASFWL